MKVSKRFGVDGKCIQLHTEIGYPPERGRFAPNRRADASKQDAPHALQLPQRLQNRLLAFAVSCTSSSPWLRSAVPDACEAHVAIMRCSTNVREDRESARNKKPTAPYSGWVAGDQRLLLSLSPRTRPRSAAHAAAHTHRGSENWTHGSLGLHRNPGRHLEDRESGWIETLYVQHPGLSSFGKSVASQGFSSLQGCLQANCLSFRCEGKYRIDHRFRRHGEKSERRGP